MRYVCSHQALTTAILKFYFTLQLEHVLGQETTCVPDRCSSGCCVQDECGTSAEACALYKHAFTLYYACVVFALLLALISLLWCVVGLFCVYKKIKRLNKEAEKRLKRIRNKLDRMKQEKE